MELNRSLFLVAFLRVLCKFLSVIAFAGIKKGSRGYTGSLVQRQKRSFGMAKGAERISI